jgi:hypothetical protein
MRATLLSLVVLVAAVVPAPAQFEAQTVTIKVGRLATIPVTVDADDVDYVVLGDALDGFREFDRDAKRLRIRVIGYQPGTGYVVVTAIKGGKLIPLAVVTVKVTGAPVPPPTPPDPPTPPPKPPTPPTPPVPPPADPWVAELRTAFASDVGAAADKSNWKATLSGFFAAMADHAKNPAIRTVGDLLADFAAAKASLLPDGALAAVRRVCGGHVAEVAPADADAPLDPLRDKFAGAFARLAQALEQVK